jgi:asparagine synthase (glutamine-hydrolysing)
MCGIGGVHLQPSHSPERHGLEALAQALAHRGPDDEGIEFYGSTAFVHRRLSIIDLSTGHQPLNSSDGQKLIVNGEVYNYIELKETLAPYPYKTHSDCEVLLALYQEWGYDFLKEVRGMYALALYDPTKDELILARDPFGIKQLYYALTPKGVAFASEPQALIQGGFSRAYVHPQARSELLEGRYSPGAQSIFAPIKRVLPGEILVFQGGVIKECHKIGFSSVLSPQKSLSETHALKEFDGRLRESIALHLRSDVPYGLFLSGGLDSGILLHRMAQDTGQTIKTFTIGFDHGSVHDEREPARLLANRYGTDHEELLCTKEDFWSLLPLVAAACDDPVFDQALVPTYMLAKQASRKVKVVLCGEGGDELLGGYRRYQKSLWPAWLGGRLRRQRGLLKKAGIHGLSLRDWDQGMIHLEEQARLTFSCPLIQAQWIDSQSWLAHSLLIKLDRCLMAHGLEGRTPFLEPRLGDFCLSLPHALKIHWGKGKWLLRRYAELHAPHLQPFAKKKGFRVPVPVWIQEKGPRLGILIAKQAGIEELFDPYGIKALFTHPAKKQEEACWMLLFYALWHQIHIMKVPVVPDTLSILSHRP